MIRTAFRTPDRIFRLILGIVVVAVGIITMSWWGILGLIPLFTAFYGCPVCSVLGIGTCKVTPKR